MTPANMTEQTGWSIPSPMSFSLDTYPAEIDKVEHAYESHFGTLSVLTRDKWSLIERFGARVTAIAVVAETSMGELAAHLMRDRTPDADALAVFAAANGLSAQVCGPVAGTDSSVRSQGHGPI